MAKKTGRPLRQFSDEVEAARKLYPWLKAQDKKKYRERRRYQFVKDIQNYSLESIYNKCCVCSWERGAVDFAHKLLVAGGGDFSFDNIIPLCPNCHRLNDKGGLNEIEKVIIDDFLQNTQDIVRKRRLKLGTA